MYFDEQTPIEQFQNTGQWRESQRGNKSLLINSRCGAALRVTVFVNKKKAAAESASFAYSIMDHQRRDEFDLRLNGDKNDPETVEKLREYDKKKLLGKDPYFSPSYYWTHMEARGAAYLAVKKLLKM